MKKESKRAKVENNPAQPLASYAIVLGAGPADKHDLKQTDREGRACIDESASGDHQRIPMP